MEQNAEVWVRGPHVRVFSITKDDDASPRYVVVAHATFPRAFEEELQAHGAGAVHTALGGYTGTTTYTREQTYPDADATRAALGKFQASAKAAGFGRKGMIALRTSVARQEQTGGPVRAHAGEPEPADEAAERTPDYRWSGASHHDWESMPEYQSDKENETLRLYSHGRGMLLNKKVYGFEELDQGDRAFWEAMEAQVRENPSLSNATVMRSEVIPEDMLPPTYTVGEVVPTETFTSTSPNPTTPVGFVLDAPPQGERKIFWEIDLGENPQGIVTNARQKEFILPHSAPLRILEVRRQYHLPSDLLYEANADDLLDLPQGELERHTEIGQYIVARLEHSGHKPAPKGGMGWQTGETPLVFAPMLGEFNSKYARYKDPDGHPWEVAIIQEEADSVYRNAGQRGGRYPRPHFTVFWNGGDPHAEGGSKSITVPKQFRTYDDAEAYVQAQVARAAKAAPGAAPPQAAVARARKAVAQASKAAPRRGGRRGKYRTRPDGSVEYVPPEIVVRDTGAQQ